MSFHYTTKNFLQYNTAYLTILFQITPPLVRDTLSVCAFEKVRSASRSITVGLVAPVAAVVVEIATPQLGYAFLAVGASKLEKMLIKTVMKAKNFVKRFSGMQFSPMVQANKTCLKHYTFVKLLNVSEMFLKLQL